MNLDADSNSSVLPPFGLAQTRQSPIGHWLSVVTHLDPRYGGLSAAIPQLGSATAATGKFMISLAAFCTPNEVHCSSDYRDVKLSKWPASRGPWMRDHSNLVRFEELITQMDGVHVHGLWEQSTQVATRISRLRKLPYVVSAHGMLEPWALANKRWKKLLYSALFERRNVCHSACLHALTLAEAGDYRRYGAKQPIAVIPNGVRAPKYVSPQPFLDLYPDLRGKRIVLFLGRIDLKKGLGILVQAWKRTALRHSDAQLVLAGPDLEGVQAGVLQTIAEEGVRESVSFTGMLAGEIKWSALAAAECFVLPSYSEGLSMSTLEAMAMGLPVVISENCNLPVVRDRDAGWVIAAETGPLEEALGEVLDNSSAANRAIGERGRSLVRERYDWDLVGRQMGELYAWLQGGDSPCDVEVLNVGGHR